MLRNGKRKIKLCRKRILFVILFQVIIIAGPLGKSADNSANVNQSLQSIKEPLHSGEQTTLIYQSFYGDRFSGAEAMAVDNEGYIYVTGDIATEYTVYPGYTTLDQIDIYVTKFDIDGHSPLYTRIIGGVGSEGSTAIMVDETGAIYISGSTSSADFPCTNDGFDLSYNGAGDIFILKLDNSGQNILSSTFLGGNGGDTLTDMEFDESGDILLFGYTDSTNYPVSLGAYNESINGGRDIFITKMDSNLQTIQYSTYFGGSSIDFGNAFLLDEEGNLIFTGSTASENYPTTINAYNIESNGGFDIIVTKFNITSNSLLFSTFIGGSSIDDGFNLEIDKSGNIFIVGRTYSTDFPVTDGGFATTFNGGYDAFLAKIDSKGENLLNSTFIGGYRSDLIKEITQDEEGNIYITGNSDSNDFPITPNAYITSINVNTNTGFILKISNDCSQLLYSTFTDCAYMGGIFVDSSRKVYAYGKSGYYPYFISLFCETDDLDEDSVWDWLEINVYGTLTNNNDTDNDGLLDGVEIFQYSTDPLIWDTDGDGLSDWDEIYISWTNPINMDTDYDGMPDGWELSNELNPNNNSDANDDLDGDGLTNLEEFNSQTDLTDPDSDDDGMTDGWEISNGLDPNDEADADGDQDEDGLTNHKEFSAQTDPTDSDSDDDGLLDGEEVNTYLTDPNDPDSDDDGYSDYDEIIAGSDPNDATEDPTNLDTTDDTTSDTTDDTTVDTESSIPGFSMVLIGLFSAIAVILLIKKPRIR